MAASAGVPGSMTAPTGSHDRSGRSATLNPFARLDLSIERMLGTDFKIIYGVLVPMLVVCGVIILLAFHPAVWLVAVTLILEMALLALVVIKLLAMLGDDDGA
jgi:hypothetical protein